MNKLILLAPLMALLLVPMASEAEAALGDEWAAIKKTLGNAYKAETTEESLKLLADARGIYMSEFAGAARTHDPATHEVIMECYDKAKQNYQDGDNKQAKLWIQCQEKSIYTLGMVMMEDAVSKNNSAAYIDWVDIVKTKFKVADKDAGSLALLTAIENDPSKLKLYSGVVRDNMLDIFELKTVEELEEALIKYNEDDTYGAKKYAYEGLYYYRTLDPYVVDSIGQGKADQLYGLMEKAMAISDSANDGVSIADLKVQMKDTKKEVEKIVMKHNGIAGTPEALALAGISDRLHLVKVEYVDAIDGTGAIINDMEYAETVAFAHGAVEIADENAEVLKALGASDFEKLQSQLSSIASDVDNFVKISTVLKQADEATLTVKNLQANAGEGGANLGGYFETIDRLLITAQAAYANGDADLAHELVGTAYLDNYEFLEAPIGEVDNKLMKTIEDDMRENLRNMITSGSSYNDVESHILMINNDLKTAQAAIASGPAPKAAAAAPAPTPAPTPAPAPAAQETQQISLEEGGGCLIATAAFGSEMAPQVQFLREIRDNTVMNTQSGTAFMTGFNQVYYSFSPAVADLERENPVFKEAVKVTLTPMLTSLTLLNYVEVDTEEEMLGYGISLILLNIGMYFVAPAAAIVAIKKRFF
ncbi:CFI-box-CTERM domain-containing protein [Candidatus Nitrosopelagicus brevis]|uniref:CFI-box-CTERM domain-containing protein n=1 Tax=Candidatus Nitrosopelagicus brevis TaxID=1410606 RepID=UPI001EE6D161|nr:CFI-box-CTERM domain-containing protein [Candidatus Nitrosopelagicus brevis]